MKSKKQIGQIIAVLSIAIGGIASVGAETPPVQAAGAYGVTRTMHIGGDGRWDYVSIDPAGQFLYVPRQSHTQIIRTDTGEVVGDIADTAGVHGVGVASDAGRGFTTNGKADSLTVFDLKTAKVLGTIKSGKKPDAIIFDPSSKQIFAFDGDSQDATVVAADADPATVTPVHIPLGGAPESAAVDGKGHVYVNLEDKNSIVAIDSATNKVQNTWKIEGGEEPAGLAIDAEHGRLFAGCHNDVMAVIDTQTGKTLATVPIGKGVDACGFDPGTGEAFASCNDGTLTVIKETSPGKFEAVQTVHTAPGARTMTLDPRTHTIYLPTAEFEPPVAGEKRPRAKAGTFMIVVAAPTK